MDYAFIIDRNSPLSMWWGTYRGLEWEIRNWQRGTTYDGEPHEHWNYYVIFCQQQFTPEEWRGICLPIEGRGYRGSPNYRWSVSPVYDLPWHGGISFYRNVTGVDELAEKVKWGCDYGHDGDEQVHWSLDMVQYDLRATIDAACELYPRLRWRCPSCGEYETPDEALGFFARDGAWWEHYACAHDRQRERSAWAAEVGGA